MKGKCTWETTPEEIANLRALEIRNTPVAAVLVEGGAGETKYKYYKCPVCGNILRPNDVYCSGCGQRIDTENTAL